MRTSQIRFVLYGDDEERLLAGLDTEFGIRVARPSCPSPRLLEVLLPLPPIDGLKNLQYLFCKDVKTVDPMFISSDDGTLNIVDKIRSNVIEFIRSRYNTHGGRIDVFPGRVWVCRGFPGGVKPKWFTDWSSEIFRFIKRSMITGHPDYLLAPDARHAIERGQIELRG